MPSVPSPSALKEQLAVEPRRIHALWHREDPPAGVVVEKFSLKGSRYRIDRNRRPLIWSNFERQLSAGSFLMPDPQQDLAGADAYLRQALDNIDDVVVFYTDRFGLPDDPLGRRTGRELWFVFDRRVRAQMRFWFGMVHTVDLEIASIGDCALNEIGWTLLPSRTDRFQWDQPDQRMFDEQVGAALNLLLEPPAEPAAMPAPARAEPWYRRLFKPQARAAAP